MKHKITPTERSGRKDGVFATKKGQVAISHAYNVAGIPRFMVFSADGRIYSADAPRPSDDGIKEFLEDAAK